MDNKNFYYQIKRKLSEPEPSLYGGLNNWEFPPVFVGCIEAKDKKEAKILIEDEYDKKFPLRVLSKDIDKENYLLKIEEITESNGLKRLIEINECSVCGSKFRIIDKYNDLNIKNKGGSVCSDECSNNARAVYEYTRFQFTELTGIHQPIIYRITNKLTGKCYIGKTTQAFTLRWYQHFFQTSDTKFHKEIKNYKVSDWIFEVIESIIIPEELKTRDEIEKFIIDRERFHILVNDSIENGYNSKL